jgi:glucose/arabinose dehydrogenase
MLLKPYTYIFTCCVFFCQCTPKSPSGDKESTKDTIQVAKTFDSLPAPFATKSVKNFSKVIGWPKERTPIAPSGFTVTVYADSLENPRWLYVTPNGDLLIAEANTETKGIKKITDKITGKSESQNTGKSANRITIVRDENKDGTPDLQQVFLSGLHQPFGMLSIGNAFYVANTDALMEFAYQPGQTQLNSTGKKILQLPAGGYNNHWTRNIVANPGKTKIYIAVGSGSNDGENGIEKEERRANILEVNIDGTGERIFASGLRNPVGMDWAPGTQDLWTVVNERDELGDNLVPDYLTKVMDGGFYGWPYAYIGQHEDPNNKNKRPDLVQQSITPDFNLGSHTSSLGLCFYNQKTFPAKYHGGAFIAQHGSWNRTELSGYKILFIPFKNGKPSGEAEDFLTGFISDKEKSEVYGRPAGLAVLPDGSLLVSDDASNTIWRVQSIQ